MRETWFRGDVIRMGVRTARCPFGGEKIDESAARVNSAIAVAVLATALVTGRPWLLGYLALDYFIKLTFGFACSPNCIISRAVANMLALERVPVDSAPKRFATLLAGFMTALALFMAYTIDSMFWFDVVTLLFIAVVAVDLFADFCLGCYLYQLLPERVSAVMVRRQ